MGRSSKLKPGKIAPASLGDHQIVLFRGSDDKQVHALAAHCIHMGCHLKAGKVIGDHIRCPLHFRQFDGSGKCRTVEMPAQPTYPAIERFGAIFVFLGKGPVPEFPTPYQQSPDRFATLTTRPFEFALPWYALIANGCDLDHLQTVHQRRLKEPPEVGALSPGIFRIRYRTEVVGSSLADRLVRRISGGEIRATISCFGGSLMLVESQLGKRKSFLLLSMRPKRDGTSIQGIVGLRRRGSKLVSVMSVHVAGWLFLSFLKRDLAILDDLKLHRPAPALSDGDRYMSQLFDYFNSLDRRPARRLAAEAVTP